MTKESLMIIPHSANVEGAAKKERKFKEILIKEKSNNSNAPPRAEGAGSLYKNKPGTFAEKNRELLNHLTDRAEILAILITKDCAPEKNTN